MPPLAGAAAPPRSAAPYIVWLLTLASVVSWRRGVYFSGGLDPVVVIKGAVGLAALAAAAWSFRRGDGKLRAGSRTLAFLLVYVSISILGAISDGNLPASLILTVRVLLIAVSIVLLAGTFPPRTLVHSLLAMMALVGLCATASGLETMGAEGRIYGVFPPLNPNEISLLCGLPALGVVHELSIGTMKNRVGLPLLAALLAAVWMTGSRTGFFAFAVACVLILMHARRLRLGAGLALIALVPVGFYVLTETTVVSNIVERGDAAGADLLTLNARTIAWDTVLSTPADTWQRWVGAGLSVKQVAVEGQYWQDQVLDSSWISALAQAGVIGTVVLGAWSLSAVLASLSAKNVRSITTPILAFILIRSFLENGLVDSNVPFIVFLTVSLLVERVRSSGPHPGGAHVPGGLGRPGAQVLDSQVSAQGGRHNAR